MAGAETLLALTLGLVRDGVISLERLIAMLTTAPAAILGLDTGTLNAGALYYRDTSSAFSSCAVSVTATMLNLSLTISDTSLNGADIIYTQGGSLPNWTPDGIVAMCQHKMRLWCNDSSDYGIVRYSKEAVAGECVSFALANTVRVPGVGAVTAFASLDSTLVIFRRRSIYGVAGDGPDDTGLNGSFSDGQLLFAEVGCVDQRSLCRFQDGVIFKSDKGFYLLGRDLQLSFVGAEVDVDDSKTIVSSEVVALNEGSGTAEECRFLCSDGTLLVYNYNNNEWTKATLSGVTDAVQTGGRYVVCSPTTTAANARVFQQSLTTYLDGFATSSTYQMTVETGWIKTADVQGFQRIWSAQFLGTTQDVGTLSIEVGYDYETAYNETHTSTIANLTAVNYTGAATPPPQGVLVPVRQKCQAIRFRIKDIPNLGNTLGAVFKLTNISLECGVKSGTFRLPGAKGF